MTVDEAVSQLNKVLTQDARQGNTWIVKVEYNDQWEHGDSTAARLMIVPVVRAIRKGSHDH